MTRSTRFPLLGAVLVTMTAATLLAGCGPESTAASASTAGATSGTCESLTASAAVKQAVTTDYGRQASPRLVHLAPVKGTFYYGSCDGAYYAAARFQPTAGATTAEQVALQDGGAAMKYLTASSADGTWRYLASDGLPSSPRGCAAISRIPSRLAALWADCRPAR